jgi:Ca2+-transporting ATPase
MDERWHALSVERCLAHLSSDADSGLSAHEAGIRLERDGANRISGRAPESGFSRFLRQLREPLIYILIGSGALALFLCEWVDAAVIFGVVLVNAVVGAIQEARASSAIAALASRVPRNCRVLRDRELRICDAADLVVGDVLALEAGDQVPADLRLLTVRELLIDEAMLTGESLPVEKELALLDDACALADRRNLAFAGTLVLRGTAKALVVATANSTELGHIAALMDATASLETPLTRRLARFSKQMLVLILALAALTLIVGLARGLPLAQMLMATVALAVGAIPEGLPAALTITLAIGVGRMARRSAVIRRLPAVEALGSVTVICTDKTGTLTENRMAVAHLVAGGREYRPGDAACEGSALRELLLAGVFCSDATLRSEGGGWVFEGDPTEAALLPAALASGLDVAAERAAHPRLDALPFDASRQWMATLNRDEGGGTLWIKGAPERVLSHCVARLAAEGKEIELDAAAELGRATALAAQGYRVLAFARRAGGHLPGEDAGTWTLLGFQALEDPPRQQVPAALARCREAGVRVVMITGDHAATACGIAERIALSRHAPVRVLTGSELAAMDDEALRKAVRAVDVFARVLPEQKLRLVEALQATGEVVAMTGDGVNDAPALKQADIGIAMGRGGTDVAKQASAMVLADDNFATIVAAIEEGRAVYDNLQKFMVWTLPTNFAEGLIIFIAVLVGLALPITPLQILWINMSTVLLLGLALAFEPGAGALMQRPPRAPREALLPPVLMGRVCLAGALLVAAAFSLFHYELATGSSLAVARTAAANLFVFGEMSFLLNCRSLTGSWWRAGWWSNRWLWPGMIAMAALQLLFTYLPAMQAAFGTRALSPSSWLSVAAGALAISLVVGAEKAIRRLFVLRASPGRED